MLPVSCQALLRGECAPHIISIASTEVTQGLGNKFLDDLRTADILLHIVDVSGTTNEKARHPT